MSIPPNNTIYIQNLNEKIQKQELRRTLYSLFSQFGPILDVVALKTHRMRGQAWIAFRDIVSATRAVHNMHAFKLYDRPMKVSYSKHKSHAVAKMDGTFGKKETRAPMPEIKAVEKKKDPEPAAAAPAATNTADRTTQKQTKGDENPPNRILLLINLPEEANDQMLRYLFNQFPGLKEVRQIPTRRDVAFVEYDTMEHATEAKEGLQGFLIKPNHPGLVIMFAKA